MQIGKYRGWVSFKAYNPWAETVARTVRWLLFVYVALCMAQMVVSWFQLIPLRQEFAAGEDKANCQPVRIEDHMALDCHGFYDKIVAKRNALMSENGCFHLKDWMVVDEVPQSFGLWSLGPVCYEPFPFGTLIQLRSGTLFESFK